MNSPLISIVIPCFNQGHLLEDALQSIQQCKEPIYEVIIVNDGSTDSQTNEYLLSLSKQGYNVIFQTNQGLGAARNNGIKVAVADYVLLLDADNMIYPGYLLQGIQVLQQNPAVAVVYSNAEYFGEKEGILKPGSFNLQRLLLGNFIDACAVIRKSVLDEVGYYDNMKIMGYEDWDLWLRIAFKGYEFYYIDEVLFRYRVASTSMMKSLNRNIQRQNEVERYLSAKYKDKLGFELLQNHFLYKFKKAPFSFMYRIFLKKIFPRYYARLINSNKMYNGWLYDRS